VGERSQRSNSGGLLGRIKVRYGRCADEAADCCHLGKSASMAMY
jgi:hypothetical protein